VGDPAAAQETGGGRVTRGSHSRHEGLVHVLYVKDGTTLVHAVIDPAAIN